MRPTPPRPVVRVLLPPRSRAPRVYHAGQLPAVSTMASSPALTGASPWVFHMVPSDATTGAELVRYAAARGWRRAAVLYEGSGRATAWPRARRR